nr:AI-2E family transporter [Bacilli bacterium]
LSIAGVLFTGLVVGLYMLIDFDRVHNAVINIIPNKYCKDCSNLLDKIGIEIRKTVNGTLLVALMVLVCDSLLFMIIGLDSPLLFGTICGLTDLIPYIGPYIGGLIAVVVGFSESSTVGIGVLISCFVVQIIENNILQPIVMSKTTKLHPVLIICGLLLFGHFFGITGMIFATPALTLIKCIYEYVKDKYLS